MSGSIGGSRSGSIGESRKGSVGGSGSGSIGGSGSGSIVEARAEARWKREQKLSGSRSKGSVEAEVGA
jgi:hypothetical protein